MPPREPHLEQPKPGSLSEPDFSDLMLSLRSCRLFVFDEEDEGEAGFKPLKMSMARQSLLPLRRGVAGRAAVKNQAALNAALNNYFVRVGWTRAARPQAQGEAETHPFMGHSAPVQALENSLSEAA